MTAYDLSLYLLRERARIELELGEEIKQAKTMSREEALEFLNNALMSLCVQEFPSVEPDLLVDLLDDKRTQEALNCTYFKEYHIEH